MATSYPRLRVESAQPSTGQGCPNPLGDGTVGWGRQLRSVRVEFYDRFDDETDADARRSQEVTRDRVAFTVAVMDRAFRRTGDWALLDVVPLSEKEEAAVYRSFKQDPDGALSIYFEKPDGSYGEANATRAECEVSNARGMGSRARRGPTA